MFLEGDASPIEATMAAVDSLRVMHQQAVVDTFPPAWRGTAAMKLVKSVYSLHWLTR